MALPLLWVEMKQPPGVKRTLYAVMTYRGKATTIAKHHSVLLAITSEARNFAPPNLSEPLVVNRKRQCMSKECTDSL